MPDPAPTAPPSALTLECRTCWLHCQLVSAADYLAADLRLTPQQEALRRAFLAAHPPAEGHDVVVCHTQLDPP